MQTLLHASFDSQENGIRAVEALPAHGPRLENINLIFAKQKSAGPAQSIAPLESYKSPADLHAVHPAKTASLGAESTTWEPIPPLPAPPPLPSLPAVNAPRYDGDGYSMAPSALGYHYDALGAVLPDPVQPHAPETSGHRRHEAAAITERAGIELGIGLAAVLASPGLFMIAGAGLIAAGRLAVGAVSGTIAGGMYDYLVGRGIGCETVEY